MLKISTRGRSRALRSPLARMALSVLLLSAIMAPSEGWAQTEHVFEPSTLVHLPTWTVGEEVLLSIGGTDEREDYLIGHVSGARLLPGGRVLLLDGTATDIRVFSPDGSLAARFGGVGEGPGEFSSIGRLTPLARDDGAFVFWDSRRRVVSTYDETGSLIGHFTLSDPRQMPQLLGVLPDDSFLFHWRAIGTLSGASSRVTLDTLVVAQVLPATGEVREWRRIPNHSVVQRDAGLVRLASLNPQAPALPGSFVALDGGSLLWATTDRAVFEWWSPDEGALHRTQLELGERTLDDDAREDLAKRIAGTFHDDPSARVDRDAAALEAAAREALSGIRYASVMGHVARHSGGEMVVMVQRDGVERWHPLLLSNRARPLGWLAPLHQEDGRSGHIMDIRDGQVLIRWIDNEYEIEELQVRRILPGPGGAG